MHGTIVLDEYESRVISTRAYQRMRGVKHLGLASLTFPGADYSRFAHGIGTLHVMGQILNALSENVPGSVDAIDKRTYRMAALLHDVGHFPFSHTFERALTDFYTAKNVLQPIDQEPSQAVDNGVLWKHEDMGSHVILDDPELRPLLDTSAIDVELVTNVITRAANPPSLANLISSDLDADRTDYLMRTAKHTGLPYGNVDLPYLLSQICLDEDGLIAFTEKGMRAAEHLLLCRYFDYQQVSYRKTVAGMELVLNDAVKVLFREGALACAAADLQQMISDGSWYTFDDADVMNRMRTYLASSADGDPDAVLFESILRRWPPKLIFERERLGPPSVNRQMFNSMTSEANKHVGRWREKFAVPFYIWTQKGTQLTKIGSRLPVSEAIVTDGDSYERAQQAVRIKGDNGRSCLIQEHPRSLMPILAEQGVFSLRIYALLRPDQAGLRSAVEEQVQADLSSFADQQ